jgi:Rrf2 family protein
MLAISRQTDYACRIVLHLAMQPGNARVTAADIAQQRLIPPALIRRIVTTLAVAGVVRTTRGQAGGIALARTANQITLLDVVQAIEGPLALNPCTIATEGDMDRCPFTPVCPVHETWVRARQSLSDELSQVTFSDLAERGSLLALPGAVIEESSLSRDQTATALDNDRPTPSSEPST